MEKQAVYSILWLWKVPRPGDAPYNVIESRDPLFFEVVGGPVHLAMNRPLRTEEIAAFKGMEYDAVHI